MAPASQAQLSQAQVGCLRSSGRGFLETLRVVDYLRPPLSGTRGQAHGGTSQMIVLSLRD